MIENIEYPQQKILIAGAGALGIALGCYLSSQHEVFLYGREKLKSILSDDISINNESYKIPKRRFNLKEFSGMKFDEIFVTTKLFCTKAVMNELKENNIKFGSICVIQNGLVSDDFYVETGIEPIKICVYDSFNLFFDKKLEELSIKNGVNKGRFLPSGAGEHIFSLLNESGINCNIVDNIDSERAEKLILNSSVNGLSGMYKVSIGELISGHYKEILGLMKESYTVLALKFKLDSWDIVKESTLFELEKVYDCYPTTYQDVISGRETEVAFT